MVILVPTPTVIENYSNIVVSQRALELISHIAISRFRVCSFISFLFSALVAGPINVSSDFTGAEDIAARRVLLSLLEGVNKFVQFVSMY